MALECENAIKERLGSFGEPAHQLFGRFHALQVSQQDLADVLLSCAESKADDSLPIQEQCFDDFQIVQPPRALLDRFSAIVAPSFRIIYKLHLQIQNLRRTRDLLLPRLLSGQGGLNAKAA